MTWWQAAVADGQPALGITDHGNMYGILDFYAACRAPGSTRSSAPRRTWPAESRLDRPVRRGKVDDTGGDVDGGEKLYYHLTLLAETDAGYRNLLKLSSEPPTSRATTTSPGSTGSSSSATTRASSPPPAAWAGSSSRPCWPTMRTRPKAGRPAPGHLRAGQPLRRAPGPRACPSRPDQPARWWRSPGGSGRRCWPPTTATTPTARTPWPTTPCSASRPGRTSTTPSDSSSKATSTT